jgi:peptide/nickel transport system substrate-binding protein
MIKPARLKGHNKLLVAFFLILLVAFFSAGTALGQTPRYGGTLKMVITNEPFSLGYPPTMTGQTDGQISSVCLETLFRFDREGNLVPLLATGWKADPAAKTITITLRQGVKFQDGSDFNAEVCKWNLEQYQSGARQELKKVSQIDIIDAYTIHLTLAEFDNTLITFLANCADAGRMISRQAFEKNGKSWCEANPVGTGPFQFVSRQKDVSVIWKKFDGYWGGKPYLDEIQMLRIEDPTVALMSFKAGQIHILGTTTPINSKALETEGKYVMVMEPQGQVPAIAGYSLDPESPFSKLKVRQAMAYALDTDALCKAFGQGYWVVQNQWAVPGTWGYNPDVKGYPYDPEKAKRLLSEAGYPNGFKTKLNFFNLRPIYVDEATAMQRYLQAVGIEVELVGLQRPKFAEMASLGSGWAGMIRMQGFSSPDPLIKYAGVVSGQEFKGLFMPPELVKLYYQATAAPDFKTKQKLVHELMKMATDTYCIASFLYLQQQPIFKSTKVHDDLYGEIPYRYISPKTWVDK